jgi:hypothetical protein
MSQDVQTADMRGKQALFFMPASAREFAPPPTIRRKMAEMLSLVP